MEEALEEERREVEALIAARDRPRPRPILSESRSSSRFTPTPPEMEQAGKSSQEQHMVEKNDFIIEELSDFGGDNGGTNRSNTIQPDEIEDPDSDQSEPKEQHKITSAGMGSSSDSGTSEDEFFGRLQRKRARDRQERISTSSMAMRTMSSSDSEHEDVRDYLTFDQVGSSARRLRKRKKETLLSLQFQDPPPTLDKMEEFPEGLEDAEMLGRELPFYASTAMEMDSPWASSSDVSHIPLSSGQNANAEGNERAFEEKESFHGSSSIGIEPELPQKLGESATSWNVADETMSVQSYADSIFDAGSVGSSASSVFNDTQALVEEFVGFLARDLVLDWLFMVSMRPTVLGPKRFRRDFTRILQSYARDLKRQLPIRNEPEMPLRTQGLAFISRRSITMKTASIIASRYRKNALRAKRFGSTGDESPVNDPNHAFVMSELGIYRAGEPFNRMRRSLQILVVHTTALNHVRASTERILDLVLGDEYLRFLLFKALSDPLAPLRDGRFEPETEIRYFGSRLKAEANSPNHVRLAEFIKTYAGYIATRAVQRMEGMDMEAVLQGSRVSACIMGRLWRPVTRSGLI